MSESTPPPQKNHEALTLFVVYTAVIIGTMWLSGRMTSPSIYDRFLARLEGVSIAVRDAERSKELYEKVLSYQPAASGQLALLLPDKRKLFLRQSNSSSPSEIVLRVRNGFPRLYEELKVRVEKFPPTGPDKTAPTLSPITTEPWGDEFVLTDYDQNRFIYFRPLRRASLRGEGKAE